MEKTITINGKEFTVKETENEVILSTNYGKFLVENVFKKDTSNDKEILSRLDNTMKTALYEYMEKSK